MAYKKEGTKQLTIRVAETEEILIEKLKKETNTTSATKALISAGAGFLNQKTKIQDYETKIHNLEKSIINLKRDMEDYQLFFTLFEKLNNKKIRK